MGEFTKQKASNICEKAKYANVTKNALAKVENKDLFSQLFISKIDIFQKLPLSIFLEELNMTYYDKFSTDSYFTKDVKI